MYQSIPTAIIPAPPHPWANPREFEIFFVKFPTIQVEYTVNIYVITCFCAIFNVYFYANSTIIVSEYRKITHLLKSIQENWSL